jgi:hypothetical protein
VKPKVLGGRDEKVRLTVVVSILPSSEGAEARRAVRLDAAGVLTALLIVYGKKAMFWVHCLRKVHRPRGSAWRT